MSLQVWLPLTKDLRNQGLCNIGTINSTAVYSATDGKLGGCYKFTSQTISMVPTTELKNSFSGAASISCWVKVSTSQAAYAQCVTYGTVSTAWTAIFFGIDINASGIPIGNVANGSSNTNCSFITAIKDNQWHHLCLTYTTGTIKSYLDGVLKNTVSTSLIPAWTNATTFTIGGNSSEVFKNGDAMNDVRLYNHCLSEVEVKELAKGLILHYPLNDKYIESTTNLITTEDCLSATCYNGATSKYSYGTNTDMYKTVTTYDGRKGTKVYMGTNGNQAFPYVYINNMFTSDGTNQPAYKTLSFDYYTNVGTSIRPYKLGSGSGTASYIITNKNGITTGTGVDAVSIPVVTNGWNHIEITFHGTTAANSEWGYIQNYPQHTSNTSNFWFFANMQLEEKDHATGYAGVGGTRSLTTMYDCSGYCNNGTISGTLSLSSDTPRYNASTQFNGTQRIEAPWNPSGTTSFSVSGWFYHTGGTTYYAAKDTYNTYIDLEGSRYFVYNSSASAYVGNWSSAANTWQHVVLVHDANATRLKLYVNGNFVSEVTTNGTIYNSDILDIGGRQGVAQYSGKISDFRIYATALSAEDVLELYHTAARIDNVGNTYVYQYIEA